MESIVTFLQTAIYYVVVFPFVLIDTVIGVTTLITHAIRLGLVKLIIWLQWIMGLDKDDREDVADEVADIAEEGYTWLAKTLAKGIRE